MMLGIIFITIAQAMVPQSAMEDIQRLIAGVKSDLLRSRT